MAYITERRCIEWLRDFTINSAVMNDPVSQCVKKRWGNTAMTAFGYQMTDQRFDSLYGYIAAESKKYPRARFFKNDDCLKVIHSHATDSVQVNIYRNKTSEGYG